MKCDSNRLSDRVLGVGCCDRNVMKSYDILYIHIHIYIYIYIPGALISP
jgi:hypothetical protein